MFRVILSAILALVLALTSQNMAVAKGANAAVDHVVICSGAGVSVIFVDANGDPTEAPHLCPDCLISVPLAAPSGLPGLPGVVRTAPALPLPERHLQIAAFRPVPPGRAPPA